MANVAFAFLLALTAAGPVWGDNAARIVSLKGDVSLGEKQPRAGDAVGAGEVIRTGDQSAVKLLLVDQSIVDIGANTLFTVESSSQDAGSKTRLDLGLARSSIHRKLEKKLPFHMRTKTSVLAVRGTEFIVRTSGQPHQAGPVKEQITVVNGQVGVQTAGMGFQLLKPAQQFNVTARWEGGRVAVDRAASSTVQLTPEALAHISQGGKFRDPTFRQQIEIESDDTGKKGGPQRGPRPNQGQRPSRGAATVNHIATSATTDSSPEQDHQQQQVQNIHQPNFGPGGLNAIAGSGAENAQLGGAKVKVIFRPNP